METSEREEGGTESRTDAASGSKGAVNSADKMEMPADAIVIARHLRRRRRRERVFQTRVGLFGMSDVEVFDRYRFPPHIILDMLQEWGPALDSTTMRSQAIPGHVKLLSALHFFATGSFQRTSGVTSGISQPSQSRALHQVLRAILGTTQRYIRMPTEADTRATIVRDFYRLAGFPRVSGAIDCTHVALTPPAGDEHLYRNRHHWHSINVQAVCDAECLFLNVFANYPGSAHDSFIYRQSAIYEQYAAGVFGDTWLLGDSGYPIGPHMLTPFRNPVDRGERNYNRAHIRARNTIERAFGILKSRFRCLDHSGGVLLYQPPVVCQIIVCCCVLHNIALQRGLPMDMRADLRPNPHPPRAARGGQRDAGLALRRDLIAGYFA